MGKFVDDPAGIKDQQTYLGLLQYGMDWRENINNSMQLGYLMFDNKFERKGNRL